MERISNIIKQTTCYNMTSNHALNKENKACYDMIDKREYVKLLKQLEDWRVFAPKAIVKKYGVKTVQLAVEYTKATPNVRVPGAYFTYMVRQLKTQNSQAVEKPQSEEKEVLDTNIPNEHKIEYRGSELPQVENWQDAREFLCDYMDGAYEKTDNIISFVNDIKRRYNFG